MIKIILFSLSCMIASFSLRAVPDEAIPEEIQRQAKADGYQKGVKYQSNMSNVIVDKDDHDVFMQHASQATVASRPVIQQQSAPVSAPINAQQLQSPQAFLAAIQAQQRLVEQAIVIARGPLQSPRVAPRRVLNIDVSQPAEQNITLLPDQALFRRSSPSSSPGVPGEEDAQKEGK